MCKDFRKEGLNGLKGTRQHFIGKIKRRGGYERDGIRPFIIAPLYVKRNEEWVYVDHAWINLPEGFVGKQGQVIEFAGRVYDYEKETGKKSTGVDFAELYETRDIDEGFDGPRMDIAEASLENKRQRCVANKNIAIIAAYENGEDLSVPAKNDMKEFVKMVKLAQARGKHGWAYNY